MIRWDDSKNQSSYMHAWHHVNEPRLIKFWSITVPFSKLQWYASGRDKDLELWYAQLKREVSHYTKSMVLRGISFCFG